MTGRFCYDFKKFFSSYLDEHTELIMIAEKVFKEEIKLFE